MCWYAQNVVLVHVSRDVCVHTHTCMCMRMCVHVRVYVGCVCVCLICRAMCGMYSSYFGTLMPPLWRKEFGSAEKMLAAVDQPMLMGVSCILHCTCTHEHKHSIYMYMYIQ